MAQQLKPNSNLLIQRMQSDIDRQQTTIASLRSHGHRCPDAEQQLQLMKEELELRHNAGIEFPAGVRS